MNISVEKIIEKIEGELRLAKGSINPENLREKIYSIKILCELILDEQQEKSGMALHKISQQPFSQSVSVHQSKKLEMNDEANGDSLLDF